MRKTIATVFVCIMVMVVGTSCNQSEEAVTKTTASSDITSIPNITGETMEYMEEYLKTYFNIDCSKEFTVDTFKEAMEKVSKEDVEPIQDLNGLSVIRYGVEAANYKELAMTYKDSKVEERLYFEGLDEPEENGAYIATALDAGLISNEEARQYIENKPVTKEMAVSLLMQVADANGLGQNYLGYSDDENIDAKLENAWNSFSIYDDEVLSSIGKKMVENKITTGYNLKNEAYNANFLPELTLQYGHSDIKHAHQLVALLNSENIYAKVQLEPKVSIYEYLLEWGPIPESTKTYQVKKFSEDLYLVYALEYDLQLEFETKEDRNAFHSVIETYAKKYDENKEDMTGLIYGAWWQPLYSTTASTMNQEEYKKIKDYIVTHDNYSIHTFCLQEDETKVEKNLKQALTEEIENGKDELRLESQTRYVNNAFYRYLKGDYQ
ncbi:MAG: hypothetical protein KH355_11140 [Clostridiales bacterium]|nr:hypothetical protein [Clostridiales bacterium]